VGEAASETPVAGQSDSRDVDFSSGLPGIAPELVRTTEPVVVTRSSFDVETDGAWEWISRISPRTFVATLTIAAAILRLLYLGKQSLWVDEGLSVALTQTSWHDMLLTTSHHDAMSPYLVLLRLWTICFGDSEAALRMPSVIFSVATLAPLYELARRLAGKRVAAVTVILFAVNGFSIRYAQETRCYSLMGLLVVGSWVFFLRCLDAPAMPNYTGYVATSVLGAYTHIFNTFSYPAQWIPIMRRSDRMKPQLGLIASIILACGLILPKGLSVILTDVGQDSWISPLGWMNVLDLLSQFCGSRVAAQGEVLLLTRVYLIAACYGALALIFGDRKSGRSGSRRRFVVLGFAIPIGVVLIVSTVKPLLLSRYLIEALPFFMIICAVGLCRARPQWLGAAGLAAIAVLSVHQDYLYYRHYKGDDWRGATTYILSNSKPGDSVVFVCPAPRWPYDYYVAGSGFAEPPPVIFPDWDAQFRVAGIVWTRYYDEPMIFEPLALRVIDEASKRYARIWLVLWPGELFRQVPDPILLTKFERLTLVTGERVLAAIGKRYQLYSAKDFSGQSPILVLLYDRAGGAPP
jgi:mannosyltransferase